MIVHVKKMVDINNYIHAAVDAEPGDEDGDDVVKEEQVDALVGYVNYTIYNKSFTSAKYAIFKQNLLRRFPNIVGATIDVEYYDVAEYFIEDTSSWLKYLTIIICQPSCMPIVCLCNNDNQIKLYASLNCICDKCNIDTDTYYTVIADEQTIIHMWQ